MIKGANHVVSTIGETSRGCPVCFQEVPLSKCLLRSQTLYCCVVDHVAAARRSLKTQGPYMKPPKPFPSRPAPMFMAACLYPQILEYRPPPPPLQTHTKCVGAHHDHSSTIPGSRAPWRGIPADASRAPGAALLSTPSGASGRRSERLLVSRHAVAAPHRPESAAWRTGSPDYPRTKAGPALPTYGEWGPLTARRRPPPPPAPGGGVCTSCVVL